MLFTNSVFVASILSFFTVGALAVDSTSDEELVAKLKGAATQLDRINLLENDDDWVFDYTKQKNWNTDKPGSVVNANSATFPAVVGNGMTMAMLNLGPCSMLPPHLHPRASNYVVAVSGETHTYMINENGARTVEATLTPGKMTIFPAGSMHMMENVGCTPAQLVSALNNEDQGTLNVVNNLMSLPDNLLNAATGYAGIAYNKTRSDMPEVGTGAIYGSKECLARCQKQGKLRKF